ncbi:MAG: peptidylprolyl isomerase, partial [Pseudomonadota bacterium]|nr:peptidylprolyl isomerase [Pseudomonadota bacterium]
MRIRATLLTAAIALACSSAIAQTPPADTPAKPKSAQEIIDAAPASDWRTLDPANTLYLDLSTGRVIIELAPAFAPAHVANIKALAKGGYWNGLSINRSQDNYVVQWGDPTEDEKTRKPLSKNTNAKLPA